MRYELHCFGQVIVRKELEPLLEYSEKYPGVCVIYKIIPSKFPKTKDTLYIRRRESSVKRFYKGVREVLSYNNVVYAYAMTLKGKRRSEIAKHFRCTPDKLRLSLEHYDFTCSQTEYENTQPYEKINLLVSK